MVGIKRFQRISDFSVLAAILKISCLHMDSYECFPQKADFAMSLLVYFKYRSIFKVYPFFATSIWGDLLEWVTLEL